MKRGEQIQNNVSRPSNPPDELAENVSKKKKIPVGRIIPPFFLQKFRIWPFFSCIYMIRIRFFGPGELNQNGFGRHSIALSNNSANRANYWQLCFRYNINHTIGTGPTLDMTNCQLHFTWWSTSWNLLTAKIRVRLSHSCFAACVISTIPSVIVSVLTDTYGSGSPRISRTIAATIFGTLSLSLSSATSKA